MRLRDLIKADLAKDKQVTVMTSCPSDEKPGALSNYAEIDVVFGKFRNGYVASQDLMLVTDNSTQPKKMLTMKMSTNVLAEGTLDMLARDAAFAFESLKFQVVFGMLGKRHT